MVQTLAQLVIQRCDERYHCFRALLYLAVFADDKDFVKATLPQIATGMRMGDKRTAQALQELERDGYITRMRWGHIKNRRSTYYFINREVLLGLPVRDLKFPGKPKGEAPKPAVRLSRSSQEIVQGRVRAVQQFMGLQPGEHYSFLEKLRQG